MTQSLRLAVALLLVWQSLALAQGQRIGGDRTVEGGFNAGTATGAVNTFALTLAPALNGYVDRQCFLFKANLANTGVATLNVNALGAKTLKKRVAGVATDLAANDIGLGQYVYACYDGTVMQAQPLGGGTGGGSGTGTISSLTGDVTASGSGAVPATLANIPAGIPHAGSDLFTAIAAPGTPAAGKGSLYLDSTSKNIALKDDAGVVKHGVQTISCGAQFINAINDAGLPVCATPAGGGNVSSSGTPTLGLTAEWLNATTLVGIGSSGSGLYLKQTNASLITPGLGVASATSINKVTITAPTTSATLTIADTKTLTASNTVILTATDGSTAALGAGGTVAYRNGTPTPGQLATWASASNLQAVTALPAANFPAITGDVTIAAAGLVSVLANIPTGIPHAGSDLFTAIAAPGTPAAGKASIYVDSTSKALASKNDAGVVSHTVQSVTCSGQFLSAISDAGVPTCTTVPGSPTRLLYDFSKSISNNTLSAVASMTIANNTTTGIALDYGIHVKDASNVMQVEVGRVLCQLTNVGGALANNVCTKVGNNTVLSAGTLTVTWSLTAANPSVVSVTVASSLTPSATFPLVLIPVAANVGNQTFAMVP